jgi:Zn-dependent protease
MLRSWKLGSAFGIGVYLNPTFLLLPAWVFLSSLPLGGLSQALYALAILGPIFFCVVLHEFGHALMARRFGIGTRRITLYPIGGVAQLERMSEKPAEEFWIAIAGPAVNVAIAFLLFWPVALMGAFGGLDHFLYFFAHRSPLFDLWLVNIMLVVFNMIPAFPMDGGRVLRALLATQLSYVNATRAAVWVGTVVVGLLVAGMMALSFATGSPFNPMLLLVAGFVLLMGRLELWALRRREALRAQEPIDVLPVDSPLPVPEAVPVFVWDNQLGWVERGTRRPLSSSWVKLQ